MTDSTTSRAAPAPISHRQVLVVFSGLLLAMLLAALDSTIVATALPTIVGELGGLDRLAWVVTAYLLAQTIVTPIYGKLGDLYGRKGVLQGAIVLFLIGSVLCGMSRNMAQLILFRGIQGLGGGGLMVTTQAVVGDIVPPRERGRYQGIFGAVFGVSSIAGPLLGGFFTTHLSWRWIFYINLPLGALALVVLGATLPAQSGRVRRSIDYAGAGLLAVALSAIILVADLGGVRYAWTSATTMGLVVLSLAALAAFVAVERRAAEPVLPLRLFGNRAFSVAATVGLIVGFALFGSVTYLPLFLQVVKGSSPTASGLQMLPMMGGMLVTSIISGQLISRTGRYKLFPVAGTAVATVGLFLLSRMTAGTSTLVAAGIVLLLGFGLGMVMQVLVIAVQNAVDYADLGVATSGSLLFRLIGGAVGTAVLGAIFAARLAVNVERLVPASVVASVGPGGINPQSLARMPAEVRTYYAQAFTESLSTVFLVATAIAVLGFVLALLLPERPLRETVAAAARSDVGGEAGDTFVMPREGESLPQLLRGLAAVADRDVQRRYLEGIVARAGLDVSAAAAWLLMRIDGDGHVDPAALAATYRLDLTRLRAGLEELRSHGLVVEQQDGGSPRRVLTPSGCDALSRLVDARRARLAELFGEWHPERREAIEELIGRLGRELVPDAPLPGDAPRAAGSVASGA